MQFRITRIDIEKTRENWPQGEFAPAFVLPRNGKEHDVWHVIDQPIRLIPPHSFSWAVAAGDEYIRIPLFLYNIPPQGDLALSFMFRLGLVCGNLTNRNIKTAHIVTGNPAELVYNADGSPAHLSSWIGVAFIFEE